MSPRLATFLVFVVNGAMIGTWVALIPGIKTDLGASATELGLVILLMNVGALVAQQVTGQLLMRFSSRTMVTASGLILPWLVILPVLAPSPLALALLMAVFGYVNSTMDLSMNAHGVALETGGGTSIMSRLHAGWSVGGVIGAMGVALALQLEMKPLVWVVITAIVLWVAAIVACRFLGRGSERQVRPAGEHGFHLPTRAVAPLALLIVLIAFVEGGLTDWGGVYLREGVGAGESIAAMAFAALSVGLVVGRLGGDWAKDRIGSIRVMQGGMLLTAAAIAGFLLIGNDYVALVGLIMAGVGIANTVPQIFAAAGRIPPHGPSLSAVYTSLTLTFMLGPTIIGTIADTTDIGAALWLFAAASLVVALMVPRFPAAETNPRFRKEA